jgi:hypothetical protein
VTEDTSSGSSSDQWPFSKEGVAVVLEYLFR